MGRISSLVYTGIEVCKESKVPVLFISNPGYGKTTLVKKWAEKNDYHVETIIGSSFAKEEVQGYQVNNGKQHLDFLEPYWYTRIMSESAAGRPTILFIDEISTAPADVQGSLFRLIFDRCIGNGSLLPQDCLIISAANYKENLPDFFEITAPALNRFCVINLVPKSADEVLEEYLTPIDPVPEFTRTDLSPQERQAIKDQMHSHLSELIKTFPKGAFVVQNQALNTAYSYTIDSQNRVLNFMSGRTVSYLADLLVAIKTLGIRKSDPFIAEAVDGLIGLGTNSFASAKEHQAYLVNMHKVIKRVIFDIKTKQLTKDDVKDMDVSEIINRMQVLSDTLELSDDTAVTCCVTIAEKLNDYQKHFAEYVQVDRDLLWAEAKSVQLLSKVSETSVLNNMDFSANLLAASDMLLSLLGDTTGTDLCYVLVCTKDNQGREFSTIVKRKGRSFVSCTHSTGLGPVNTTLHHDKILMVFDGTSWVKLDMYLKGV